jgi:D-glycero-D-manno-heptose 1,7-bisphosphate phosphatase
MRAVFLDRDGVLNRVVPRDGRPGSPRALDELEFLPGVAEAAARLRAAGLLTFVVTNQPDLARGLLLRVVHDTIMARVQATVLPDDAAVCPHDDHDDCQCRKPRPGMLTGLAARWDVKLTESYMVGDSWKDVAAGRAAGCRTVLVRTAYNIGVEADMVVADMAEAANLILETAGATS